MIELQWESFDTFDALPGDVVLRRWLSRETGLFRYAVIEYWKTKDDYFPGNDFLIIEVSSEA